MKTEKDQMRSGGRSQGGRRTAVHLWLWMALWTLLVGFLLLREIQHRRERSWELASAEARVHLNKDMAARLWVASHGGLYVPVTKSTPPNPHLSHVPERDITTPRGRTLTLMNPAYMLRQMMEHYAGLYGTRGHITGLKHFGPQTAPDEWERAALLTLQEGGEEVCELCKIQGEPYLRIMRPLRTERECLKCHGFQGYRVGDVRGGVSISLPTARYLARERRDIFHHGLSFVLAWAVGAAAIGFTAYGLMRRTRQRNRAEDLLRQSEKKYSSLVENSLTGIYVNLEGRIVFANPRLADMFGYTVEELTGMDYLALVHPEDREVVAGYRDRRLHGLETPAEYEVRGLTKGGHTLWTRKRNALTEYEGRPAILGNVEDVTERRRNAAKLEESEGMLRELSVRLIRAHEEERKKVAYEIHEGLAQTLSAAKFRLERILADLHGDESLKIIQTLEPVVDIMRESIAMVRRIAQRLRPLMLDDLGVLPAVAWLCRQVETEYPGLAVRSELEVGEEEVPELLKVVVYRILERALYGIAAQGDADNVRVSLRREGRTLVLTVRGNGKGLGAGAGPPEQGTPGSADLATIQERCMLSGASLSISPHGQGGSTLSVSWPLEKA